MARVVSLRTVRRQRARDEERRRSAEATGRPSEHASEAARRKAAAVLEQRRLDGHRRDGRET